MYENSVLNIFTLCNQPANIPQNIHLDFPISYYYK